MEVKPMSEIRTRRDFHDAFQSAMSGAHETLRALWHFEKGQNLPKSYFVEFHPNDSRNHRWNRDTVFSTLDHAAKQYNGLLRRTDDDALFFLGHNEQGREAEFIVDCLNSRFLVFHTLSNVEHSDRFIVGRLTRYRPEFDLFWFPVSLLERVEGRERVVGWEAQFEPLVDVDFPRVEAQASEGSATIPESQKSDDNDLEDVAMEPPALSLHRPRVKIDLECPDALETYSRLKQVPKLLPDVPLNAVLAERQDEEVTSYARARITSKGKVTGRGPDFSSYLQIVDSTLDDYARIIEGLEANHCLRLATCEYEDRLTLRVIGEPFSIKFSRDINARRLVNLMFDCARPFRLMGEVQEIGENYFAVDAIDLHVNQPVGFEISPNFIRIYLYEGTCGNTLVRIIRSLQHHVDSKLVHPPLS
jgi:hypothetical protein